MQQYNFLLAGKINKLSNYYHYINIFNYFANYIRL